MRLCSVCSIALTEKTQGPGLARAGSLWCSTCNAAKCRAWQQTNRKKYLQSQRDHYQRTREQQIAESVEYRRRHPEKKHAQDKRYYARHKEKWRERARQSVAMRPLGRYVFVGLAAEEKRKTPCAICGTTDRKRQLHHLAYDVRDPLAHTIAVCLPCHRKIERNRSKTYKRVPVVS